MNRELKVKVSQDFETHLNFNIDLTGSLRRISVMSSKGRFGRMGCSDSCDLAIWLSMVAFEV